MGRRIILDVDTGTDDAVAIMFAALHPDLEPLAITTVNGNVALRHTTDNTLRVLDWIGRPDIPVYPGLSRPLVRHGFPGDRHFEHGGAGDPHGIELPLPAPVTAARETGAVEYLVHTLRTAGEPVTLVATGPLSNVAAALAIDPGLTGAVDELVVMGGGHETANVTASAEFNIWADPEAAQMVFTAGFARFTLVTLDATHRALVTRADCDRLDALGTPAGTAAARIIGHRVAAYEGITEGAPVHDVLCPAYLVRPDVISTRHVPASVETTGALTVGRTVLDLRPETTAPANAHVALNADAALLNALLTRTFGQSA